jgi:hypothetical protein
MSKTWLLTQQMFLLPIHLVLTPAKLPATISLV